MSKEEYKKQNNELLKEILSQRFFIPWANEEHPLWSSAEIELYVTNHCNQKCKYCYLYNNDSIYPKEYNNSETICNNLKIYLEWLLKNNYSIPRIDLYSGEIWQEDLGRQVLEILLYYVRRGVRIYRIIIPTNGTFILQDETLQPILQYISKFKEHNTDLLFSLSIDGMIVDNYVRQFNDESIVKDEEYYEKIFSFVKETYSGFHPMVSAYSIENWIENFEWWKKQLKKYDFPYSVHSNVMMLEVRNNDWTKEKIEKYGTFIEHLAKDFFVDICKQNKRAFADFVLTKYTDDEQSYGYLPWVLAKTSNSLTCSIPRQFCLRLGDLAICPCHRTAQENNIYGYFKVEDNEIVDIEAKNFYLAGRILLGNNKLCSIKCDTCKYAKWCIQGCYGSQVETNKDIFIPVESLCDFFSAKIKKIIEIYEKYDCFKYFQEIGMEHPKYFLAQDLIKLREGLKDE